MIDLKERDDRPAEAYVHVDIAEICQLELTKEDQPNLFNTLLNVCNAALAHNGQEQVDVVLDGSTLPDSMAADMEMKTWKPFIKQCITELGPKMRKCAITGLKKKFQPLFQLVLLFVSVDMAKKVRVREKLNSISDLDSPK